MENPFHHPFLRQSDWASLHLGLQWVYEGDIRKYGWGKRPNPHLAAWLILEGEARVKLEGHDHITARQGEWLFLPPGERWQDFAPATRLLSLCWRAKWPDGQHLFEQGLPIRVVAAQAPDLESSARQLLAFRINHLPVESEHFPLSRGMSRIGPLTYFQSKQLLLEWLTEVIRTLVPLGVQPHGHEIPDRRVLLALELLEHTPLSKNPRISHIAAMSGLSISQLNRLFSRHVGHSPKTHLQNRRLAEARSLLTDSRDSIKEIAHHLGFPSSNAFYNWFLQHHHCGPRAYRSSATPDQPTPTRLQR